MRTTNNKPFHLNDHWQRFVRSTKELRLTPPITKENYKKVITDFLAKTPYQHTSIRTVLTGESSEDGMTLGEKPTFYILLHDMNQFTPDQKLYRTDAKIIIHDFSRHNPLSKTTAYIKAIKYQKIRNQKKPLKFSTPIEIPSLNVPQVIFLS